MGLKVKKLVTTGYGDEKLNKQATLNIKHLINDDWTNPLTYLSLLDTVVNAWFPE